MNQPSDWKRPLMIGFIGAIGGLLVAGMALVAFLVFCFAIGDDPTPAEIRQREHHAALRQAYDEVGAPDSVRNYRFRTTRNYLANRTSYWMNQVTDDVNRAMRSYTALVLKILYVDAKGKETIRIVSPYRWIDDTQFVALCLSREAPRQFKLDRIKRTKLVREHEVVMPVEIMEVV